MGGTVGTTRRRFLVGSGALVLAACAAPLGTGGTSPRPSGTPKPTSGGAVTYALELDVIDLDPLRSRARVDRYVHYQVYDSLVRIDRAGKIVPGLAERWESSSDGKAVTFVLRDGVRFHDGTPFDADAVKWNIDRYRLTKGSSRSGELAPIDNVAAVDKRTVRFDLKAPSAPLLANLVDRAGMMVSRKVAEAAGDDFTRKAFRAGTGAFVLTEAVKDDHLTLERNPEYWETDADGRRLPYLDKIGVRPIPDGSVRTTNLRAGSAHVTNNIATKDVAGVRAESALEYQEEPGLEFFSIIPNRAKGFVFGEGRYVRAVSMAIDRQEIRDKVFFGTGAVGYGALAPAHFAFDPAFAPFGKPDVEGAKRLVAEVGKGPLRFEMLVRSSEQEQIQLAQLMQAQLAKADITMTIRQLQFAEILKIQAEHTFPGTSLTGWSGRVDPDGNVYDHVYTGRPFNDSSYSNADVDRLLDEQRVTTDQGKRRDLLRRAERIYAVDDPARVWYRFGIAQLLTAKQVRGLAPYPDNVIRFQYAWLER